MRWFRVNPSDEDPARLLVEAGQWTQPWGSSDHGATCDKCDGAGATTHECWSCLLTGRRDACPVCSGRERWEDRCPVCRGSGRVDGRPRHGVSVYPTREGLYHYLVASGADLDDCVIVELEGDRAEDVDFDADQGAMLVIPTRITGCDAVDRDLAERVKHAGLSPS